jgi:hypothetical protein
MPVIKLFFDICLFRKGPQHVPASQMLLGVVGAAYLTVGLVLLGLETNWVDAILQVIAEAAMMLGFLWITLSVSGLMPRFLQTTIAMLGSDAMISSLAVPLIALIPNSHETTAVYLGLLFLMLWHLAVVAHIFRHALSRALGVGIALAIVYVVASYQVMLLLFAPTV